MPRPRAVFIHVLRDGRCVAVPVLRALREGQQRRPGRTDQRRVPPRRRGKRLRPGADQGHRRFVLRPLFQSQGPGNLTWDAAAQVTRATKHQTCDVRVLLGPARAVQDRHLAVRVVEVALGHTATVGVDQVDGAQAVPSAYFPLFSSPIFTATPTFAVCSPIADFSRDFRA